jgi:lactoylglutathione lyase
MKTQLFTGYSHVGIYVRDREAAIKFYEDVLGFELLFKVDNESDGLLIGMLKLGNCYVEVLEPPEGKERIVGSAASTVNHIGITVSDIDAAMAYVNSFGFEFEDRGKYDVPRFGNPEIDLQVAFFRGPNGERIELFQEIKRKST